MLVFKGGLKHMSALVASALGTLMTEVNTHLAQQSEKLREDLRKAELLRAQQRLHTKEASEHISSKVCKLQNDCCFPLSFTSPKNLPVAHLARNIKRIRSREEGGGRGSELKIWEVQLSIG